MRKNPILKYNTKGMKKLSNKRVRKNEVSNGNNYRKVFESWDILDWKFNLYRPHHPDNFSKYNYGEYNEDTREYYQK